jgi:hypothetical protein
MWAGRDGALPVVQSRHKLRIRFDRVFSALDHKSADGASVRILGIHDEGGGWWVRVARGDDDTNTIVLRVSQFASVLHAVAALTRWNAAGVSAPRIVRAMCLV